MCHTLAVNIVRPRLGQEFAHGTADMGMYAPGHACKTGRPFAEHLGVAGGVAGRDKPVRRMGRQGGNASLPGSVKRSQEREEKGLCRKRIARRGVKPRKENCDIGLFGAGGGNAVWVRGPSPRRTARPDRDAGRRGPR